MANPRHSTHRLTLRVAELEEENKALSEANLRSSQAQGRRHGNEGGDDNRNNNGEESHHAVDGVGVADDPAAPFIAVVVNGAETACLRRVTDTLAGCHGGTNVLCARACPSLPGIVASGGADMSLQVSRLAQGLGGDESNVDSDGSGSGSSSTELHRLKLAAPVLSMDFCPSPAPFCGGSGGGGSAGLLLAGGMDGSSHLVSIDGSHGGDAGDSSDGGDGEETTGKNGVALLASMKNHAKYVVVCRY
ncbi:unnamed protein product, partial [Ectocarpus fasciculatus]